MESKETRVSCDDRSTDLDCGLFGGQRCILDWDTIHQIQSYVLGKEDAMAPFCEYVLTMSQNFINFSTLTTKNIITMP